MIDVKSILTDKMKEELLDRFDELTVDWRSSSGAGQGGDAGMDSLLGRLEGRHWDDYSVDNMRKLMESPDPHEFMPDGLEAIILRFGRPAYFVQEDTFRTVNSPSSSAEINGVVEAARQTIEKVIPSVGRINLRNHHMGWAGTGWLIARDVIVTNRHVARLFAEADGDGFIFIEDNAGRKAKAYLDVVCEHNSGRESVFRMHEVLWIEPGKRGHHDVAFLKIKTTGEDDQHLPEPIQLMNEAEFDALEPEHWLALIGYPANSIYNNADDQQRIFQGVFDVKRLQPGRMSYKGAGQLKHDATTLGGNSGSVVLDLQTGKAMALHFGGYEGDTNFAVDAKVVRNLMREKLDIV